MALLEVSSLSKSFDGATAVDRVSLEAERGELLCLLGLVEVKHRAHSRIAIRVGGGA